jgi:thermitase
MRRYALVLLLLTLALPTLVAAQSAVFVPNDPLYARQWALAHIGAPCAWQVDRGSSEVTVAVIDSGIDPGHPDLAPLIRNDGFDFVEGDADPRDENGHGTHVAGIVAATIDNAEGIAGLAQVRILPVRVMNAEGLGNDRSIAAGIAYAVDQGAQVINLSLGATLLLASPETSTLISSEIRRAIEQDVVVVVAAGNDFVPLPNAIVGENEDVLVVAASTADDLKAPFSNSGPWVDVTAPGEQILSTMPTYEVFLTSRALPAGERFRNNYDYMSGTSQATPFVSALAGLLFSLHPDWTAAQVIEEIKATSVDIYPNHPSYYQRLRLLGTGRIDACTAVGGEPAPPSFLELLFVQPLWLVVGLGTSGLCLLTLAVAGAGLLYTRRRRPAPIPAAPPVPVPQPSQAPQPVRAGDTLVVGAMAWGQLRFVAGPVQVPLFSLDRPEVIIGRAGDTALSIADPTISRRHARMLPYGDGAVLEDLGAVMVRRSTGNAFSNAPLCVRAM